MIRRLIIAALVLVALAVIADLLLRAASFDAQRPFIEATLSEALGLEVRVNGEVSLELLPEPRMEATDVSVANLPGRPSPHLLEIGELGFVLGLRELLTGTIAVRELTLRNADLRIEPDESGGHALPPELEELMDEEPGEAPPLEIYSFEVEDLRVFYRSDDASVVTSAHFSWIDIEEDAPDAPVMLRIAGDYQGGRFDIQGQIGPLIELLWPTRPYPVSLRGELLGASVSVEGSIGSLHEL